MINQARLKIFLLVSLLCINLPFLILTLFINPALDDFCYAEKLISLGFIDTQKHFFSNWSGRYFSTAVLSLSPITFGSFAGYKIISLAIIILTFIAIFAFVRGLLNSLNLKISQLNKLLFSGLLFAIFSNQMPDITENYYWLPGSISYQLGNIMTLFLFAANLKYDKKTVLGKVFAPLISFILIIAIVGCSETSMIVLIFLISAVVIWNFTTRYKNKWLWSGYLMLTLLCTLIVVYAPGNTVRSDFFPNKHQLFFSIGFSLAQEVRFLVKWLSCAPFLLCTILYIPIADKFHKKLLTSKNKIYINPVISLLIMLALLFLGFFPAYWSTGLLGQYRTVNSAFFFFLPAWFINLSIWIGYLRERYNTKFDELPAYVYILCVFMLPVSLISSNNLTAITDLFSGRAYKFDLEMRRKHFQLEQCAKDEIVNCRTDAIDSQPDTISNPYFLTQTECDEPYWKARTTSTTENK